MSVIIVANVSPKKRPKIIEVILNNLLKEKDHEYCFFDFTEDPEAITDAKSFYKWETVPMILKNNMVTGITSFVGGLDSLREHLNEG